MCMCLFLLRFYLWILDVCRCRCRDRINTHTHTHTFSKYAPVVHQSYRIWSLSLSATAAAAALFCARVRAVFAAVQRAHKIRARFSRKPTHNAHARGCVRAACMQAMRHYTQFVLYLHLRKSRARYLFVGSSSGGISGRDTQRV